MRIAWTKLAVRDIQCLRNYVEADNPHAAQILLERIGGAVDQLLSYPNLGRPGRVKGTRELVIVGTPYVIAYRVRKNQIEILAVIHGARRWPGDF